jgi:uncharacterized protein DUF2703
MTAPASTPTTSTRLRIDFLFLDLETCTRCRGTDRNLESALESARDLLAAMGTEVEVNKVRVDSAELARELRFESSPTIRVNNRDAALELRESSCGSEACTDGCGESIACRVWVHAGEEFTEPPVAMILDAILREVYRGGSVEPEPEPYKLPDNLARFFAGKVRAEEPHGPTQADCCSPVEQGTCCEAEDKTECCGAATAGSCGCR